MMIARVGIWSAGLVLLLLAFPGQALACGCCYQEFNPWPMYHHTMYESPGGTDCPGGFARTLEPHGAHGNLLPGSCNNGTYHTQCGVTLRDATESLLAGDFETLVAMALNDPEVRFRYGGVELLSCQGEVYAWGPIESWDGAFRKADLVARPEDA